MKTLTPTIATLDDLTANIKMKLVENQVLTNTFNRNINQNSIEIGQMLSQAKKLVKHGQWQFWLDDNFQMTDRTARNYMKVAAYFGVNSMFKTEYVFRFQFYALIELTKMTPAELQNFLDKQEHNGIDLAKLSVRNLSKIIKQWKNPSQEFQPTTIDIDAEFKTAPADSSPLKLPSPSFSIVPTILQAAADSAQIKIEMNFGRALFPADADILLTKINLPALQKYSSVAASVIFTKMDFVRSDGVVKKRQCCIWYFGSDIQNFADHFATFGEVINLQAQKSPLISAGKYLYKTF